LLDSIENAGMAIATSLRGFATPAKVVDDEEDGEGEETLIDKEGEEGSNRAEDDDGEDTTKTPKVRVLVPSQEAVLDVFFFSQDKANKSHILATRRAELILGASSEPPVSAQDLFDLITLPVSLTAIKEEDRALRNIFRGFEEPPVSWVSDFTPLIIFP
jgi:hypothetical protein